MDPTISLGVARKDMSNNYCCAPSCCTEDDPDKKKEWDNTIINPELCLEGAQAELMGADDLEVDDLVEVTFLMKVKGKRDDSRRIEGEDKVKRDLSLTFSILKSSNLTDKGSDKADGSEEVSAPDETMDSSPVRELMGMKDGY